MGALYGGFVWGLCMGALYGASTILGASAILDIYMAQMIEILMDPLPNVGSDLGS